MRLLQAKIHNNDINIHLALKTSILSLVNVGQ